MFGTSFEFKQLGQGQSDIPTKSTCPGLCICMLRISTLRVDEQLTEEHQQACQMEAEIKHQDEQRLPAAAQHLSYSKAVAPHTKNPRIRAGLQPESNRKA